MLLPTLYTISTLDALSFALAITTINPYVLSLGGTQFYLGVLSSVGSFVNLLWNPILGSLSDSIGRKTALLYCLIICLIGNFMSSFSSLTIFFIARILTTFGTQIFTLLKSLIDDNIKSQESKMSAIHRIQAVQGFCFISGSLLSGYLSEYQNGYQTVFYIISTMFLINIILVSSLPSPTKINKPKKSPKQTPNILDKLKQAITNLSKVDWPKYWDLFALKLVTDFVLVVFQFNFAQVVMTRFGITGKYLGYIFASAGLTGIITSLLMSKAKKLFYANDDTGLKRLLHGCLLLIYTCLGQGLSTSFPVYFIHVIPISITRVLFETTFTEVILARAGPQEKGSIMGTFETTLALAGLTAPLLSGVISDTWGNDTSILFCIAPLIFGAFVAYTQKNKIKVQ